MTTANEENDSFIRIPGLHGGELAVVESLLQAAEIPYTSLPSARGAGILIRASDLAEVKALLADFKVQTPSGELAPIPW